MYTSSNSLAQSRMLYLVERCVGIVQNRVQPDIRRIAEASRIITNQLSNYDPSEVPAVEFSRRLRPVNGILEASSAAHALPDCIAG